MITIHRAARRATAQAGAVWSSGGRRRLAIVGALAIGVMTPAAAAAPAVAAPAVAATTQAVPTAATHTAATRTAATHTAASSTASSGRAGPVATAVRATRAKAARHIATQAQAAQAARDTATRHGTVTPDGTVPAPPAGWTTAFSDDFEGPAGSVPSSSWEYDTGPGSSFGTGEIETMTNSSSNVYLDGNGDLDITALGSGSSWTSGRIQTTSANVGAPAGGELKVTASIQQPSGGLGYWPAFWMLGPGQWPENGEIDIMEDVDLG